MAENENGRFPPRTTPTPQRATSTTEKDKSFVRKVRSFIPSTLSMWFGQSPVTTTSVIRTRNDLEQDDNDDSDDSTDITDNAYSNSHLTASKLPTAKRVKISTSPQQSQQQQSVVTARSQLSQQQQQSTSINNNTMTTTATTSSSSSSSRLQPSVFGNIRLFPVNDVDRSQVVGTSSTSVSRNVNSRKLVVTSQQQHDDDSRERESDNDSVTSGRRVTGTAVKVTTLTKAPLLGNTSTTTTRATPLLSNPTRSLFNTSHDRSLNNTSRVLNLNLTSNNQSSSLAQRRPAFNSAPFNITPTDNNRHNLSAHNNNHSNSSATNATSVIGNHSNSDFVDRTLATRRITSSPFYSGRTLYGGKSAYSRCFVEGGGARGGALAMNAISGESSERRVIRGNVPEGVGAGGGGQSAAAAGLSKTARRILETLESYATPAEDARRIPNPSVKRRMAGGATPYGIKAARSNQLGELQVPRVADLLRMKERLMDSTSKIHETVSSYTNNTASNHNTNTRNTNNSSNNRDTITSSNNNTTSNSNARNNTIISNASISDNTVAYKLRDPATTEGVTNNNAAGGGKIRSKVTAVTRATKTNNEQCDISALPDIQLPIATLPTFNFNLATPSSKTVQSSEVVCKQTTNTAVTNSQSSKLAINDDFIFSKPLILADNLKSIKAINNFKFSAPLNEYLKKAKNNNRHNKVVEVSAPAAAASDSYNKQTQKLLLDKSGKYPNPLAASAKVNGENKSHQEGSFGNLFKLTANNVWECHVCLLRNKLEFSKCAACEAPKLLSKPDTDGKPLTNTDGKPLTNTDGKALTSTDGKLTHAVSATKPAPLTVSASVNSKWECQACLIRNEMSVDACIACTTPRKSAKVTGTGASNNGGFSGFYKPPSDTWSCDVCLITNKKSADKCAACETPNPKAPAPLTSSFNNFGIPSTAAASTKEWECSSCLVRNKSDIVKCVCCEATKPGSSTLLGSSSILTMPVLLNNNMPKFSFGIDKAGTTSGAGFSFGIPQSTTVTVNPTATIASTTIVATAPAAPTPTGFVMPSFGITTAATNKGNGDAAAAAAVRVATAMKRQDVTDECDTSGKKAKPNLESSNNLVNGATSSNSSSSSPAAPGMFSFGKSVGSEKAVLKNTTMPQGIINNSLATTTTTGSIVALVTTATTTTTTLHNNTITPSPLFTTTTTQQQQQSPHSNNLFSFGAKPSSDNNNTVAKQQPSSIITSNSSITKPPPQQSGAAFSFNLPPAAANHNNTNAATPFQFISKPSLLGGAGVGAGGKVELPSLVFGTATSSATAAATAIGGGGSSSSKSPFATTAVGGSNTSSSSSSFGQPPVSKPVSFGTNPTSGAGNSSSSLFGSSSSSNLQPPGGGSSSSNVQPPPSLVGGSLFGAAVAVTSPFSSGGSSSNNPHAASSSSLFSQSGGKQPNWFGNSASSSGGGGGMFGNSGNNTTATSGGGGFGAMAVPSSGLNGGAGGGFNFGGGGGGNSVKPPSAVVGGANTPTGGFNFSSTATPSVFSFGGNTNNNGLMTGSAVITSQQQQQQQLGAPSMVQQPFPFGGGGGGDAKVAPPPMMTFNTLPAHLMTPPTGNPQQHQQNMFSIQPTVDGGTSGVQQRRVIRRAVRRTQR